MSKTSDLEQLPLRLLKANWSADLKCQISDGWHSAEPSLSRDARKLRQPGPAYAANWSGKL